MNKNDPTTIRPGEISRGSEVVENAAVQFIGTVRTPYVTRDMCPRQGKLDGPDCTIDLLPIWADGLTGIEKYDFLDVLYWLHHSRRDLVVQTPRGDGQPTGTFALRSPVRPNPIGLSRVKLVGRDGGTLIVKGLDCLDKTPLIDIKPNRCEFTPQAPDKAADHA